MSGAYPHFKPSYTHEEMVEHFLLTPHRSHQRFSYLALTPEETRPSTPPTKRRSTKSNPT